MSDDKVYIKMFRDMFPEGQSSSLSGFLEFLVFFMFFYGAYCVLDKIWRFIKFTWRHFFRGCFKSKTHMFDKYGEPGSWALVTGGSDGIGLEMCHQLASQGFNIMMVARNE